MCRFYWSLLPRIRVVPPNAVPLPAGLHNSCLNLFSRLELLSCFLNQRRPHAPPIRRTKYFYSPRYCSLFCSSDLSMVFLMVGTPFPISPLGKMKVISSAINGIAIFTVRATMLCFPQKGSPGKLFPQTHFNLTTTSSWLSSDFNLLLSYSCLITTWWNMFNRTSKVGYPCLILLRNCYTFTRILCSRTLVVFCIHILNT